MRRVIHVGDKCVCERHRDFESMFHLGRGEPWDIPPPVSLTKKSVKFYVQCQI